MLKYILMAGAASLVIAIGWPLMSAAFGGGPNEATQLVEATARTNNKAESLNDSFTDIIPPAPLPVRTSPQFVLPSGDPAGPSTSGNLSASRQTGVSTGQQAGQPQPSPTPDKYAAYAHPSEHVVRDAIEYLNRLQTELEPSPTQYIQAVEALKRAWSPRYKRASDEYKRFAYRIDRADAMASEYFEVQHKLTAQIANSQDRDRASLIDTKEQEVYLNWREQAFRTLGQAQLIMVELHDMNIIITKQSLSAHFAALYEDFQTIPPAITLLHQELDRFRQESDRIQLTFGVLVD